MSWRAIHDYATESHTLAGLTPEAERLFWRILARTDAWGRMRGEPEIVQGQCLPLIESKTIDVVRWMDELANAGLIRLYEPDDRLILQVENFDKHQPKDVTGRNGKRYQSLYPDPSPEASARSRAESRGVTPAESESESESESEKNPPLDPPTDVRAARVAEILGAIDKPGYSGERVSAERLAPLVAEYAARGVDVVAEALALADWETHGKGSTITTKDGRRRLANWLGKAAGDVHSLPTGPPSVGASGSEIDADGPKLPPLPSELELIRDEVTTLCEREPDRDYAATYAEAVRHAVEDGSITQIEADDAIAEVVA